MKTKYRRDPLEEALKFMERETRRANRQAQRPRNLGREEFLQKLPKFPEVAQLIYDKRVGVAQHGIRCRFTGSFVIHNLRPMRPDKIQRIDKAELDDLKATLDRALQPHGLRVNELAAELTGWSHEVGGLMERWDVTVCVY